MMFNFNNYCDKTAFILEDLSKISYKEFLDDINELAKNIHERSLVFNLSYNCYGAILGYVSSIMNNFVTLMLDYQLDDDLLTNFIETYRPRYVWGPDTIQYKFKGKVVFSKWNYILLELPEYSKTSLHDDLGLLLSTSGSTGSPKLVRLSYLNLLSNTQSIIKYLQITDKDTAITTLPLNYTFGLSIINTHLYAGAAIVITSLSIIQKEFWQLLMDAKVTTISGVPYTYEILDKMKFYNKDLPFLKVMTQAGGKLSDKLQEKFLEYAFASGKKFFVMYGQTEATARMSYLPFEIAFRKKGSIGIPIPDGRFSLIDGDGNIISQPNKTGELVYYGENVCLGYATSLNDLNKSDENNGKLYTGDMAYCDEEGYYYIVGRKKRFLKLFGNRVSLDQVEKIIEDKLKIKALVAGKDDLMVIFVPIGNDKAMVKKIVSQLMHIHFSAIKVMELAEIPRSSSGKILYSDLEKYYD